MSEESLKSLFEGSLLEGRYRLKRLLAEGAFGGVFFGQLEIFDEPVRNVAVKITKRTGLTKQNAKDIFAEAILLARIRDQVADPVAREHIVPVHDLGMLEGHDRRGYIVMGLVPGIGSTAERPQRATTLADEIGNYATQGMAPDAAVALMKQICTGMAAVHELKVVHRDLKPDNILLTDTHQIRVVDFGLAAGLDSAGLAAGRAGTTTYMAPETFQHANSDPRSDVYSLGIILYQMLAGRYPFDPLAPPADMPREQRDQWIVDQKRKVQPSPPSRHNPQVKPWLDALVMQCLSFNMARRPANAGALLDALDTGPSGKTVTLDTAIAEVDTHLESGATVQESVWSGLAHRLEEALGRYTTHDDRWFEAMRRLALCYIHLGRASDALRVIDDLEPRVRNGTFAPSYDQRAAFYETFAEAVKTVPNMQHWADDYQAKADEARRQAEQARHLH